MGALTPAVLTRLDPAGVRTCRSRLRCGTSPRTLEAQFRARLGTTPQAHSLHLRLSEALRLVGDTDMPLMDVALATGFGSQSSFARAFRAAHGQSARALRKARKEVNSAPSPVVTGREGR